VTSVLVPVADEQLPGAEASVDEPDPVVEEPLLVSGSAAPEVGDDEVELVEETTYLLMPADDDERTQAMHLAALAADGERTQVIRPVGYEPGQTTRDLGIPGDRTQVIWPAAANRAPGERTVVFGQPGEQTRRIPRSREATPPDETQVLRLPDPVDDGESTQVIRLGRVTPPRGHIEPSQLNQPRAGSGRVTPPEDHVEPDDVPTARAEDEPPPSIAGAESPNFSDDPTGRLMPLVSKSDEPTRTMTVMNMERPPDDVPEIPSQRRPSPDED
jgi:hypothetical protein